MITYVLQRVRKLHTARIYIPHRNHTPQISYNNRFGMLKHLTNIHKYKSLPHQEMTSTRRFACNGKLCKYLAFSQRPTNGLRLSLLKPGGQGTDCPSIILRAAVLLRHDGLLTRNRFRLRCGCGRHQSFLRRSCDCSTRIRF